jgi:protein arginine N-methyltransferase 2
MLFSHFARDDEPDQEESSRAFLADPVRYSPDDTLLLDAQGKPVMMTWEREIMRKSAEILPRGGRVLNIGFGLGIVDNFFQQRNPAQHIIIEAHPDVLAHMRRTGWYDRENVQIVEGRWQEHVDTLADSGHVFDAIYYDVYQESYAELRRFAESAVALLDPSGTFSFFHGLGADKQIFYDVYTIIVELDFASFGFSVEYEDVDVREHKSQLGEGYYWSLDVYKLPKIMFLAA